MNTNLLYQIIDHILKHPEEFDMSWWHCGTTYCIAGRACQLAGENGPATSMGHRATKLLQITSDQAHSLFHVTNWPHAFSHAYYANYGKLTSKELQQHKAEVTAKRIQHFILTGE